MRALMQSARELAAEAKNDGDVPVGAVVADSSGKIIGRGRNRRQKNGDPFSHAEIEAMKQAAETLKDWHLESCSLVVTLEPCPMCAGAAVSAHAGSIIFGAWDPKMGACGSVWDIPRDPHIGAKPQVYGGICEKEMREMLEKYFEAQRF